ncbi:hypothetical protein EV360DRAFT_76208 [Lentinula raphanica]|nr:hypothetical protein EV360DRAFT_76208 [Lentinula raphanica]
MSLWSLDESFIPRSQESDVAKFGKRTLGKRTLGKRTLGKRTLTPEPWIRRLTDDGLSYFYRIPRTFIGSLVLAGVSYPVIWVLNLLGFVTKKCESSQPSEASLGGVGYDEHVEYLEYLDLYKHVECDDYIEHIEYLDHHYFTKPESNEGVAGVDYHQHHFFIELPFDGTIPTIMGRDGGWVGVDRVTKSVGIVGFVEDLEKKAHSHTRVFTLSPSSLPLITSTSSPLHAKFKPTAVHIDSSPSFKTISDGTSLILLTPIGEIDGALSFLHHDIRRHFAAAGSRDFPYIRSSGFRMILTLIDEAPSTHHPSMSNYIQTPLHEKGIWLEAQPLYARLIGHTEPWCRHFVSLSSRGNDSLMLYSTGYIEYALMDRWEQYQTTESSQTPNLGNYLDYLGMAEYAIESYVTLRLLGFRVDLQMTSRESELVEGQCFTDVAFWGGVIPFGTFGNAVGAYDGRRV